MLSKRHILIVVCAVGFCLAQNEDSGQEEEAEKCPVDSADLEQLFAESQDVAKDRRDIERRLRNEGKVITSNERVADISLLRHKQRDPINRDNELKQLPFEAVTDRVIKKYNLTGTEADRCLSNVQLEGEFSTRAVDDCRTHAFKGQCNPDSVYRSADGTCNNLRNPTWGSVGTCFRRLQPPNYVGESGFRQSVSGGSLPEPRTLSLNVHSQMNRTTKDVTHMYMFYGQLLHHDITQAPISSTVGNVPIECCNAGSLHPQCAPISVQPRDPFYSQFNTTCINLVRSAICPTCALGSRQQTNQITAFIDASFVYGNSLRETAKLRILDETGRMRFDYSRYGPLLPASPDPRNDQCSFPNTNDICFRAGDARANQHSILASLHTMFLREHNRLAEGLKAVNPSWSGEKLFQEARRIVGAQMQVIAYKEYLPITLGHQNLIHFNLTIGRRTKYNPQTDPTLYNEFSAAAFRFGHSLIYSIEAKNPRNDTNQRRLLRNDFFQPFDLKRGFTGPLLRGVSNSPAQSFDRHLDQDVTNYLHRIRGQPAGLDLASINIQRGRDHGIPTYVDMVNYCSDKQISVGLFRDLLANRLMSEQNMELLSQNYRSVDDVDLWTGILAETPSEGAVVGSTGACIIGSQFQNLKFGDRFYFENYNQVGTFTYQQAAELRKITLSKLICINTNVSQIALNAMMFSSIDNPTISCRLARGVDLSYWRNAN